MVKKNRVKIGKMRRPVLHQICRIKRGTFWETAEDEIGKRIPPLQTNKKFRNGSEKSLGITFIPHSRTW